MAEIDRIKKDGLADARLMNEWGLGAGLRSHINIRRSYFGKGKIVFRACVDIR
jgi:hypothetical protein